MPYIEEAEAVYASGLGSPLPLPYGKKERPPSGYTGADAPMASWPDIIAWIEEQPEANIAIRLAPGILGLDVDDYDGKGGGDTLDNLEHRLGPLPPTWMVTSRTDEVSGTRLYRVPTDRHWPSQAGPGIDVIRHGHRYLVWRGSLHPEGRTYDTIHTETGESGVTPSADELPELPQRWVDHLAREAPKQTVATAYTGKRYGELDEPQRQAVEAHVAERIEDRLQALRDAKRWPKGKTDGYGRGWEKLTADVAQTLRTLIAEGWSGVDAEAVHQAFLAAAPTDATWTRRDADEKWHNQTRPAVNGGRIDFPVLDGMVTELEPGTADPEAEENRNAPLDWPTLLEGEEPEPEWLVGRLAEKGQQVALVGAAKVGKSLLCLDWAASIACGGPFLGDDGQAPLRVMYVDLENTQRDIRRRVHALGLTARDLGNLVYLSFPSIGALDTVSGAAALLAEVRRHSPEVIFLDTVSRMISGTENDSDTWLNLYRLTLKELKARQIAVIRLDHFGKDAERGARGSSAKEQDVDQVWELKASGATSLHLKRTHSRTGMGEGFVRFEREVDGDRVRHVNGLGSGEPYYFEEFDRATLDVVRLLEKAGCPAGLGRDRLKQWVLGNGLGIAVGNKVWTDVVKCRQRLLDEAEKGSDNA